ncbi:MAG TPA: hypothetical protein VFS88_09095 [Micavibrio sp.]|nr:hypothetical protein [Micavibrio sp.]
MDRLKNFPASFFFLSAAVVLYALFGSPTPDDPGVIEAAIGVLLILAVGIGGFHGAVDLKLDRVFFLKTLQVLFLCGLILPTASAVYYGNDVMLIARDIAAFAFIGLPLFLSEKYAHDEKAARLLPALMVFAGLAFAVRTLIPAFNIWIPQGELLYLSNSPLSLFAGAFLVGLAWNALMMPGRRAILMAALCLGGVAVLAAAMLLDVQRATIGALFLTLLILALSSFVQTPRHATLPILIIAVLAALFYPLISETAQAIAQKTAAVGMNMRTQEALAVFDALSAQPESLFMGRGWGAVFSSPAVAGLDVNYTHSFLTTMALKGGLVTLGLSVLMALAALYQIFLIFQRDRVKGLSLLWPLLIPVLLYASHKSLDFGLILLLTGVWSTRAEALRAAPPSVNTKEHL